MDEASVLGGSDFPCPLRPVVAFLGTEAQGSTSDSQIAQTLFFLEGACPIFFIIWEAGWGFLLL